MWDFVFMIIFVAALARAVIPPNEFHAKMLNCCLIFI